MRGLVRFLTAGESHGEVLVAVIDGISAGLPLTEGHINGDSLEEIRRNHDIYLASLKTW